MSPISVEFGAPGYQPSLPGTSASDLTYHAPAFLAGVEDCNRLYAGFLNLSLALILAETHDNGRAYSQCGSPHCFALREDSEPLRSMVLRRSTGSTRLRSQADFRPVNNQYENCAIL